MLEERVAKWTERWRQEGIQQGRQEGKAELLTSLACHRFGELAPWALERIESADAETLDRWSRRLLDVGRLADLFDDSQS